MGAGYAIDLRQLLQQLNADLAAFGALVTRAIEAFDDRLGDVHAEEILVHPARRFGGSQRTDADEEGKPLEQPVIAYPRQIAAQHGEVEAKLGLDEICA